MHDVFAELWRARDQLQVRESFRAFLVKTPLARRQSLTTNIDWWRFWC